MAEISNSDDVALSNGAGVAAKTWLAVLIRFNRFEQVWNRQIFNTTLRLDSVIAMSSDENQKARRFLHDRDT